MKRLDCDREIKDLIEALIRHFLEVCSDNILPDFQIDIKVKAVKREFKVIGSSTGSIQYLEFWMELGKVIEEWIEELVYYEFYEAAVNIKKLFDRC